MPDKKLTHIEVAFWLAEARSCEERQNKELIRRNNYPFLINYFEGIEKITAGGTDRVSSEQRLSIINEYFPNTNALISEIMYQNPDILIEATKPDAEEDEPLMKAALTYFFKKADGLVENRVALFDMLYAGYCAVEVDVLPSKKEAIDSYQQPQETKPQNILDKAVNIFKKAITEEEAELNLAKSSPQLEAGFATVQDTYIRRYDPLDVPLDWRAERIKDRRYNLKKVWMSKAEFDAKYSKFRQRVVPEERGFDFAQHVLEMHTNKVLLYEFQVRLVGNKYKSIIISPHIKTEEIDCFLRPYTTNGFNMKIGSLHKYGKLYPIAFAQINKAMQDEMNDYVRHMMEVAERNVQKIIYDRNKVKSDGLTALESNKVNDLIPVDGNPQNATHSLPPTHVSIENKELLEIFKDQKNKLWSVSESRIAGKADKQFATELAIEDAAFQARQIDVQEGLRLLIRDQLDTGKDIIATFWDDEIFMKVTGHPKMKWYEPKTAPDPNDPSRSIVINALSDQLTGDYEIDVDIASARKPNRKDQLNNMFYFMTQLVNMRQVLIEQGKDINIDELAKVSKEFGWNPDKILVDYKPAMVPNMPTASGETISPEEDAKRQAMAEQIANAST